MWPRFMLFGMSAVLVAIWAFIGNVTGAWWGGDNPTGYFAIGTFCFGLLFSKIDWGEADERRAKAYADLPLAVGVVTGVRRSNLTVGDQPHVIIDLDVTTTDGVRFPGQARHVVRGHDLHKVVQGAWLPLHHNPGATDGFVTIAAVDAATAQNLWQQVEFATDRLSYRQLEVLTGGRVLSGVVMRAEPTGTVVDDRSELRLGLRVSAPEGGFDAALTVVVAPHALAAVQVGAVVAVRQLPGTVPDLAIVPPNPLTVPDLLW